MKLEANEIGIWKTHGKIKIHRIDCMMVSTINISNGVVPVKTQQELDDLVSRGFGAVKCKCTKYL